jgi:hypothetical protein
MQHSTIRKLSTAFACVSGLLILLLAVFFVASGGTLNEIDAAIVEIEKLEKSHPDSLAKMPAHSLSNFWYFKYGSSEILKQHLREYQASLETLTYIFFGVIAFFFLCIILRIFYRKRSTSGGITL